MARVVNVGKDAVRSNEFKLIPTGTKIRVTLYEAEETKTGPNAKVGPGKDMLVYTAKVVEDGEFKGRELRFNYVPLHGEGNDGWKLTTFAEAIGLEVTPDGEVSVPEGAEWNQYLGKEFVARIGQQKSQKINEATGEPYVNNTITGVAPARGDKPTGGGTPTAKVDPWAN